MAGGAAIGFAAFLLFSLPLMLLGWTTDDLFPGVSPQEAQDHFAVLPWAVTLVCAMAMPLLPRRWHVLQRRARSVMS